MSNINNLYIRLTTLNDSLLPRSTNGSATIHDSPTWVGFNAIMDELVGLTQDTYYTSLKITPNNINSRPFVLVSNLSTKVYQATNYLFETQKTSNLREAYPPQKPKTANNGSVSQTVHQAQDSTQSQVTEVNVEFNQTLTYVTEMVIEAKSKYPEGTKERTFLDKLKDGIATTKTTADIVKMIMNLAVQLGITTEILSDIFK